MVIEDMSVSGIGFITMDPHRIKKGDFLEVNFILDNAKRSEIHKNIEVMSVRERFIGGKFADRKYENDIGFYLK